jgi:cytochrome c oxidase cbb3-type subunit 3
MKNANRILAVLFFSFGIGLSFAQDGEGLFKAKCNTCHALGKNSTGPNLLGVKQKWADSGEAELLYEWVKNPQTLIASGKSKNALQAKEYSQTEMSPQAVSNEEIDAILAFVDGWKEEIIVEPTGGEEKKADVVYVPNYKKNINMFYFLFVLLVVQAIAIFVLGGSLTSIVKIELMKHKKGGDVVKTIALIAGVFSLIAMGNSANALTLLEAGDAGGEALPWLLVEDSDIFFMIIVNVFALGILLYMRRSFMEMLRAIRPEVVKQQKEARKSTVNKVLTDAVPIEEEHTILMSHEYDGIRELDNNLPPWWVWGFYFTIGFAIVYMLNYHVFNTGDLQIAAYNKEMKQAEKDVAAYLDKMAMNVDENTATLMTDSKDLSAGKTIFETNCASCHLTTGAGEIGPNLTDKYWTYGYDVKDLFKTVKNGTSKGMPEHNSKLNPIQIQQVSSYVLSMPEVKGKDAEGDIVEK